MIEERARKLLLRLLRKGVITQAEAARIAFVSRPAVRKWCKAAGFDPVKSREAWVTGQWRRVASADRQPSKRELAAQVSDAEEAWRREEGADALPWDQGES